MIIHGILDDVLLDLFTIILFYQKIQKNIKKNVPNECKFNAESFDRFISSLVLKDFLINNNVKGFYDKFVGYLTQNKILKQKTIIK